MGWNNNTFPLIIVSAGGGFTGFFMYSPAPGKGNLIAALTPHSGTDPSGNAYPGGFNLGVWNASGALTNHFGVNNSGDVFLVNTSGLVIFHARSSDGAFFWYNSAGQGLGNLVISIAAAAGTDPAGNAFPAGLSSNANVDVFGAVNAIAFVALQPSTVNTEVWHTVGGGIGIDPAFGANFTSAGVGTAAPVGFQFEGTNGGRVRLRGQVNLTANQVAFATIFTLPAGYVPANFSYYVTPTNLVGYAAGNSVIKVTTGGAVQIAVAGNNTNFVVLDGIVVELD